MRVLTAKRAQNTLAYVDVCVRGSVCVCMHISAGIFLYVMPASHTHTHCNHTLAILLLHHLLPFTPLNLGADLAFAYALCMSRLCRPIGMIGRAGGWPI